MKLLPGNENKRIGRRLVCFFCMIVFMAALIPDMVYAGDDETKTVRVGYYENEVFEEGAEEGAVKTGYAYEYYCKLSEYTGWKYEYVYGGFGDLYQMLLDGEIDLLAGLAWREERASLISYPKEIMGNESYYLVKHEADINISADPVTLNGCRIGVLDSAMVSVLERYLEDNNITAEIITYPEHIQLFDDFDLHEVDILAAESDGAYGRANSEVLTVFGTSDYYLCVNKNRQDLLAELNTAQALLAAEEPNYLNSLSSKYYSVSVTARAFSAAEREWMNSHNTLHVGYLENYLPYSDTNAQGEVTGIIKDIIPAILSGVDMQNVTVTYTGYKSYDDMIAGINSGAVDVAFPVGGGLYYSEENGIYQSNAVSSSPAELVDKGEFSEATTAHFAVNENNRMQYYFIRTNYPEAEITFYPSSEDCLAAVLAGKAGCVTLNGLRANDILRNRKYEDLSIYQTGYNDSRCFGVKIGNEGLLKLLNRGINVLGSDYAQSISFRYTGGLYSYDFVDVIRDHIFLFSAVLLAIVALIGYLLVRDVMRTRKEIKEKDQANRAKTVFLNNMSHDMRTPMNAIVGFTALAESHIDDKEQVKDYLGKISVSSRHLLSLINDVLDMSRIESGKMTVEETDVHLPEVITDLKTIVQSAIESKKLELQVDTKSVKHEDIVTDKLRLNQVLLNILSNAIKFTPEGGKISFCVSEKPAGEEGRAVYEFRIRDNGIGMSEEFKKTIFDAFTRERTSTVSGIQGTGLGMAITKNIVDMMGGVITVDSEEGKGSEFIVELPCSLCDISEKKKTQTELPDFSGKRVLLAEDNEMNQMIAEAILTEAGLDVEIAGDGAEAVEKIKNTAAGYYDIILMDIQMPRMDGYEAAKQIRSLDDEKKASIPIVAVTANAFEEDKKTAMDAGMNGHLAKPYDIPAIMEMLKKLLM